MKKAPRGQTEAPEFLEIEQKNKYSDFPANASPNLKSRPVSIILAAAVAAHRHRPITLHRLRFLDGGADE